VQTCIVHLIRASLRWVNYNDRKKVAALLRPTYNAPTQAAARAEPDALADSDLGRNNPRVIRRWRDSWELVIPLFDFAPEVRKVTYTTNMIENVNSQLRRATRNRGHFPSTRPCSRSSTSPANDGPQQHPIDGRPRQRRPLEDSTHPVRHYVPGPARPGLTDHRVGHLPRPADTPRYCQVGEVDGQRDRVVAGVEDEQRHHFAPPQPGGQGADLGGGDPADVLTPGTRWASTGAVHESRSKLSWAIQE